MSKSSNKSIGLTTSCYRSTFFRNAPGLRFSDNENIFLDMLGLVETLIFVSEGARQLYKDLEKTEEQLNI